MSFKISSDCYYIDLLYVPAVILTNLRTTTLMAVTQHRKNTGACRQRQLAAMQKVCRRKHPNRPRLQPHQHPPPFPLRTMTSRPLQHLALQEAQLLLLSAILRQTPLYPHHRPWNRQQSQSCRLNLQMMKQSHKNRWILHRILFQIQSPSGPPPHLQRCTQEPHPPIPPLHVQT